MSVQSDCELSFDCTTATAQGPHRRPSCCQLRLVRGGVREILDKYQSGNPASWPLTSLRTSLKMSACEGGVAALPLRQLSRMSIPTSPLTRLAESYKASGEKGR
jgi:hypothetical protein